MNEQFNEQGRLGWVALSATQCQPTESSYHWHLAPRAHADTNSPNPVSATQQAGSEAHAWSLV